MKTLYKSLPVLLVASFLAAGAQAQQSSPGTDAQNTQPTGPPGTTVAPTPDNRTGTDNRTDSGMDTAADRAETERLAEERARMENNNQGSFASNTLPSTATPLWLAALANGTGLVVLAAGLRLWRRRNPA